MTNDQFEETMRKWLTYWGEPEPNAVQMKEWWATFGSWTQARLDEAFVAWKVVGKKWPTESHIHDASKRRWIERKEEQSRFRKSTEQEVAIHTEVAERMFDAKINGVAVPQTTETLLFPIGDLVEKAISIYEDRVVPADYSEQAGEKLRRSHAYGFLTMMINRQITQQR